MARAVSGVLAGFQYIDAAVEAIKALRAQGRTDFTVYSAAPNHEIEEALGPTSSPVRLFTLIGALTGRLAGSAMTRWWSTDWPLLAPRTPFPPLPPPLRPPIGHCVPPPPGTRLRLERSTPTPGPEEDQIGFTVEEMANFGERVLRDIGLTSNFARLVMFMGHGSFCLNNPHKSAYDCGACGGSAGGPNARAMAQILNDPRVRSRLNARGIIIPAETVFGGGAHNT